MVRFGTEKTVGIGLNLSHATLGGTIALHYDAQKDVKKVPALKKCFVGRGNKDTVIIHVVAAR